MKKDLCKCKEFSGYTKGYFCRFCKKCIYTKKQIKEVEELRKKEDKEQLNKEIAQISWEFIEMIFDACDKPKKNKAFWVSKTSKKIYKLVQKYAREI